MKKAFLLLVVSVSFLLGNCIGNRSLKSIQSDTLGKNSKSIQFDILESSPTGIQFDTLETKVFTLKEVTYSTNIHHIPFDSLPINDIVKFVEAKYGINIDVTLFADAKMNESKMSTLVGCSFTSEYDDSYHTSLRYASSENQFVEINFSKYYPQNELQAFILLHAKDTGKIIGQTEMSINVSNLDPYKD
jgi:hypothetical protein